MKQKLGEVKTIGGIKRVTIPEELLDGRWNLLTGGLVLLSPRPSTAKRRRTMPKIIKEQHPWVGCLVKFEGYYKGFKSIEEYNLSTW